MSSMKTNKNQNSLNESNDISSLEDFLSEGSIYFKLVDESKENILLDENKLSIYFNSKEITDGELNDFSKTEKINICIETESNNKKKSSKNLNQRLQGFNQLLTRKELNFDRGYLNNLKKNAKSRENIYDDENESDVSVSEKLNNISQYPEVVEKNIYSKIEEEIIRSSQKDLKFPRILEDYNFSEQFELEKRLNLDLNKRFMDFEIENNSKSMFDHGFKADQNHKKRYFFN